MGKQLIQLLREQPTSAIALVDGENRVEVGNLLRESEQLARALLRTGVRPGQTAVLAAKPNGGFIRLVYAAMLCGLRLAVIDPEMGRENYREKLKQLQPAWAFVDARLLLLQEHPLLRRLYFFLSKKGMYFPADSGARIIATGPWMPLMQQHLKMNRLFDLDTDPESTLPVMPESAEFLITYTSGTTATPKGVVHSLGAISAGILQIAAILRGGHNTSIATHLPYFALIGINAGVTAYLWNNDWSTDKKLRFIQYHRISSLFSPPCDYLGLIEHCERTGTKLPDCLQHLFFGSAPVHRSFLERIIAVIPDHVRLSCLYGMTENLVVCAIDGRLKAELPTDGGDILGQPVPDLEIQFAEDGEICIRSPQTYSRYLHESARAPWHLSGDLGYLDASGRVVLTGRKKDMIIRRNFNLYPSLYEPTINRIPGVTECAFVGVYDENKHDEVVGLFVETHQPISKSALEAQLQFGAFSIDKEAWPDLIVFETLPRSGRQFKVNKNHLRERLAALLRGN